jgi:hypothetical protein
MVPIIDDQDWMYQMKEIPSNRAQGTGSNQNDCSVNERCERTDGHPGMCGWGGHPCQMAKLDGSQCKGDHYTSNHELWAGKGAKILAVAQAIKDVMREQNERDGHANPRKAVEEAETRVGVILPAHQKRFIIGALEAEMERLKKIEHTVVPERELADILDKYRNS